MLSISQPKTEEEYDATANSVELPEWMDFPEEEPEIFYIEKASDGRLFIEGVIGNFVEIEAAYEYVRTLLNGKPNLSRLDEGRFVTVPTADNRHRLLMSYEPGAKIKMAKYAYWYFLQLNQAFEESLKDFYLAYQWLSNHPAFFRREEGRLNDWLTDNGLDQMETIVTQNDQGKTAVILELGAPSDPNRVGTGRFADYRLEVRAATYEKAIVLLASRVKEFFSTEGVDNGNEGVKPPYILKLEKELAKERAGNESQRVLVDEVTAD